MYINLGRWALDQIFVENLQGRWNDGNSTTPSFSVQEMVLLRDPLIKIAQLDSLVSWYSCSHITVKLSCVKILDARVLKKRERRCANPHKIIPWYIFLYVLYTRACIPSTDLAFPSAVLVFRKV